MIAENRTIVARRWPELVPWIEDAPAVEVGVVEGVPAPALAVRGIQLASAYDPSAEARLQAFTIPAGTKRATVYGLGQGYLVAHLLGRAELEHLRVVLLDPGSTLAALTYVELYEWLDDPRVELVRATDALALETPFAVAPAALALADRDAWRLRDLIRLELVTPLLRRATTDQVEGLDERVRANLALMERDRDVAELFGTRSGETLRVAATGPSLAEHYERLRAGDGPLIAVDSALKPLLANGIAPDVVVTMDASELSVPGFLRVGAASRDARLVYFVTSPTSAVEAWEGERFGAHVEGERFAEVARALPRGELFASGSVAHAAIDLAVRMGAARVELYGADFATPNGQSHVSDLDTSWMSMDLRDPNRPRVENGHGEPVQSLRNLLGYLRDLEEYVARHPEVDFVNASRSGARIRGVRYEEGSHVG